RAGQPRRCRNVLDRRGSWRDDGTATRSRRAAMSKTALILALLPCPALLGCGSAGEGPPAAGPRPAGAAAKSNPPTPAGQRPPSPQAAEGRTLDELLLFHPSKYPEGDWNPR